MTLGELKKHLQETSLPDTALVVLSKDGEGNGFSPLADAIPGYYRAENSFRGEIYEDSAPGNVPALVLWPTN